jgi:hypothetical protein
VLLQDKIQESDNIGIKIVLPQLQDDANILHWLLSASDTVYHTVRSNYTEQLQSYAYSFMSGKWSPTREKGSIAIAQSEIDQMHVKLSVLIKQHATLYKQYGGKLVVLESRKQDRYYNVPEFNGNVEWPTFDTMAQFES